MTGAVFLKSEIKQPNIACKRDIHKYNHIDSENTKKIRYISAKNQNVAHMHYRQMSQTLEKTAQVFTKLLCPLDT